MTTQRPLLVRLVAIGCASALALSGSMGVAQAQGEGGLAFDFDVDLPAGSSGATGPGGVDALLPSLVEGLEGLPDTGSKAGPDTGSDAAAAGSDGVEGGGGVTGSSGDADAGGEPGPGGADGGPDAGGADSPGRADSHAVGEDALVRGSLAGVMALVSQVDEGSGPAGAMLAPQAGTPPPLPPLR